MPSEQPPGRSSFENAWRKRFEEFATQRDDDAGIAGWSESGLDARLRSFVSVWNRGRHGRAWLDAGCGAGTYARFLASQGAHVVGLDYCQPAAAKAKARDTWNCLWAVADVTRLPLRPGGFDGVLCFGVMQALTESGPAVRELAAQVKPGGEVWVDALNGACIANIAQRLSRWWRGKPVHLRYESPRRMKRLMRDAGLENVRINWIPIMPGSLKWLQPLLETGPARALIHLVPGLGLLLCHSCLLTGIKPARWASSRTA
jgi:2-polyprenyl-3-methyl-5-hydroxy-6-metoxy-1,4-benzoquinol methylase